MRNALRRCIGSTCSKGPCKDPNVCLSMNSQEVKRKPTAGKCGPTAGKSGLTAGKSGPTAGKSGPTAGKSGPTAGKSGPTAGNWLWLLNSCFEIPISNRAR